MVTTTKAIACIHEYKTGLPVSRVAFLLPPIGSSFFSYIGASTHPQSDSQICPAVQVHHELYPTVSCTNLAAIWLRSHRERCRSGTAVCNNPTAPPSFQSNIEQYEFRPANALQLKICPNICR